MGSLQKLIFKLVESELNYGSHSQVYQSTSGPKRNASPIFQSLLVMKFPFHYFIMIQLCTGTFILSNIATFGASTLCI